MSKKSLKEKIIVFLGISFGLSLMVSSVICYILQDTSFIQHWWETQGIIFFSTGLKVGQKTDKISHYISKMKNWRGFL